MPLSYRDRVVIRRFQLLQRRTADRASLLFTSAWDDLDGYDEADIEAFTRRITPAATAAKAAGVAAGVALYSYLIRRPPIAISPTDIGVTVDPRGPFVTAWHALSQGRPFTEAIASGRSVADASAVDLVVSSSRRTGDAVTAAAGTSVAYWNRETDPDACQWCVDVATQTYTSADTADFGHERCGCTPFPVFRDES